MFERFAKEARDAVTGAQTTARTRGDARITSTHLLLALADEPGSVAAHALGALGLDSTRLHAAAAPTHASLDPDALAGIGIDLEAVRARVDRTFGAGALDRRTTSKRHIPFAPDAKKVLEEALRAAMASKARRIDTGHLLVGVTLVDDGPGRALLAGAGVTPAVARSAVDAARAA
jgi:ATP-dependent Clp protease ATP-binding subunit ClpA